MNKLPLEYINNMKKQLDDEYPLYLESFNKKRFYGLRVNTSKISVEEFIRICPFKIEPIEWIENGFYYDGENIQPAKHPFYNAGLYYLQEPSAMTPANRIIINENDYVLDLCAAPGGKSTELAARLNQTGILMANDISNSRAKALLKNLELFGNSNIYVVSEDPNKLALRYPNTFNAILVDAPCSGEGMFRKDPKMIESWLNKGPMYYQSIQKEIMDSAITMLKNNGYLLYSTCTFDQRENEDVIQYILDKYDDITLVDINPYKGFTKGNNPIDKSIRLYPYKLDGEGHYLALLHKTNNDSNDISTISKNNTLKLDDKILEFLDKLPKRYTNNLFILEDKLYNLPSNINISKIRVLRSGLLLGTIKNNRLEPSQSLAMVLKQYEYPYIINFDINDIRVNKYLKGETLDISDYNNLTNSQYYLICVSNFPLGWGKLDTHILKNKYSKGWII